ncbi:MFS transporter [Sciscionella marina]|uniref:MFS transporter n=1 Tax=Sciscionella marina TaxID=508770 RepID=UPI0007C57704|nr:MFS transporter [Sciscionella marina]
MAMLPMRSDSAEIAANLDRLPVGPWHRRVVALMGIGTFFNFFEVGLGSLLVTLIPSAWADTTLAKSMVIGSAFAGELIGALVLAPLSDQFGRRRMFQINLLAYAGFSLLCTLSPSFAVFVLLRVIVGIGLGAELVLVDTYLAELVPAARRGLLIGVCYFIGWLALPVSALLAANLPHVLAGLESWRWLLIISALGAVLVWFTRRGLSESPRWLAAKGRRAEALAVLRKIGGDVPPAEPDSISTVDPQDRPKLLRRPLLGRTLLACLIWACQTIGVLGFSSIAPLVLIHKGFSVLHSLGYTAATASGYPIGAALVVLFAERFQRKHLLVISSVLVAASGALFGFTSSAWLVVLAGTALNVFNVIMGNLSHSYTPELFPTSVRSTAAGRTYSLSRLVSAVFPFITLPFLYAFGAGALFGVCAILILAMSIGVALFGPRTNARQLDTI